ncbi:MAG: hypothetical protein D3910_03155, partial [Candidatus Electrothrix sp. ATG2]|nr:hypothetical protein [Candidatus Electrothrix sp. ATG2]
MRSSSRESSPSQKGGEKSLVGDLAGAEQSLAHLTWQKHYQLVNLQLKPDQALEKLVELEGTPLENALKADLEETRHHETSTVQRGGRKSPKGRLVQNIAMFRFKALLSSLLFAVLVSCFWVSWEFNKQSHRVRINLNTKEATLRISEQEDFVWQGTPGLKINSFFADGYFTVAAPGLGLDGPAERLLADGKDLVLKQLTVSKGARLEIERNKDGINFYIYDGITEGLLAVRNSRLRLSDNGTRKDRWFSSAMPKSLRFTTEKKNGFRLHLRIQTRQDWQLNGLQITGIRFQEEEFPDSNTFVSSISRGTIELPDIGRKEIVMEREQLHLSIGKPNFAHLRLDFSAAEQESFALQLQGRVRSLAAGPNKMEQDLVPSVYVWLYHQKIPAFLGVLLGSFLLAYALLLSVGRVVQRYHAVKKTFEKITRRIHALPLRRFPVTKEGRLRLARLLGKRSGIPLLERYPLSPLQWSGAVVLVLSLLTAFGVSFQQWQGAGQGEVRLSVLAEQGGGNGLVSRGSRINPSTPDRFPGLI